MASLWLVCAFALGCGDGGMAIERPDVRFADAVSVDATAPDAAPRDHRDGAPRPVDDAAAPPVDAAAVTWDVGPPPIDAGAAPVDAAPPPPDAAPPDAAPIPGPGEKCEDFETCAPGLVCWQVADADWFPYCLRPCAGPEECDGFGPNPCCMAPGPQLIETYCIPDAILNNGCQ